MSIAGSNSEIQKIDMTVDGSVVIRSVDSVQTLLSHSNAENAVCHPSSDQLRFLSAGESRTEMENLSVWYHHNFSTGRLDCHSHLGILGFLHTRGVIGYRSCRH